MRKGDFGKDLVKARERRRLNGAEFAKEVGVSPTAVHKWENGVTFPGVNKWNIIAAVAGINPADYRHERSVVTASADVEATMPKPVDSVGQEDDSEQNTTIPQALVMTETVLNSKTVYRGALMSNIRAFHKAVMGEIEMDKMADRMERMEKKLDDLMLVLSAGFPEKRDFKIA